MKKIFISSLIAIMLVGCNSVTSDKVLSNIQSNNIDVATEYYDKLNEEDKAIVDNKLKAQIDEQYNKFLSEEVSRVDALTEMFKVKKIGTINEYINTLSEKMLTLDKSREGFKEGLKAEEQKSYAKAIANYEMVVEEDSEHYKIAQEKLPQLRKLKENEDAENQKKQQVKKANELNKYKLISATIVGNQFDLYDAIRVNIKNNTSTAVKEIQVEAFIYDKNGLPIKAAALAGGEIFVAAKDTNANIMPNGTYGADKVIDTYLDRGTIGYVKACIVRVIDYNNNEWFNPDYTNWYLENCDKPYKE